MRIVITGATGFIGSNLAKLFLKKGAEVFVLVRPESSDVQKHSGTAGKTVPAYR